MTPDEIGAEARRRVLTCTIAQGAETDLGVVVYRGRRKVDDEMMPCAVVVDGAAAQVARKATGTTFNVSRDYAIHAYVQCDPNDPNVAGHAALRDLKRAIFRTNGVADPRWGRKFLDVEWQGEDIAPRVDGAGFVLAVLQFSITGPEDMALP